MFFSRRSSKVCAEHNETNAICIDSSSSFSDTKADRDRSIADKLHNDLYGCMKAASVQGTNLSRQRSLAISGEKRFYINPFHAGVGGIERPANLHNK